MRATQARGGALFGTESLGPESLGPESLEPEAYEPAGAVATRRKCRGADGTASIPGATCQVNGRGSWAIGARS